MQFETKIAIVIREDLAVWQKLNVTAFLMSGVVSGSPEILGEPYLDKDSNPFCSLSRQPVIVLAADAPTLSKIHSRALTRGVKTAAYIEEMFATGHDDANRAVFAQYGAEDAKIVGVALRAERKIVDKITKGAKMHA
ncbi:MAG: DUF2000 family protein [Sneathiella sp.]